MQQETIKAFVGGLVRHLITTFGGGLLAGGVITQGDVEIVAGALTVLAGVAWSLFQKKKTV